MLPRLAPHPRTPVLTVTYPDGYYTSNTRPGHTVVGLLYTLDPFQRQNRTRPARVGTVLRLTESDRDRCVCGRCGGAS